MVYINKYHVSKISYFFPKFYQNSWGKFPEDYKLILTLCVYKVNKYRPILCKVVAIIALNI